MSDDSSTLPPDNIGSPQPNREDDDPPTGNEVVVLEEVKHDLVEGGVRPERAPEVAARVFSRVVARLHIGPLPPVEEYSGYDAVCPGAARDILNMAISQQRHAHWVEKAEIILEFLLKVLGMLAALGVVGGMIAASVYCAINGKTEAAVALGSGAGIATVSGVFLRNFLRRPEAEPAPQPKPKPKPKGKPKGKR